MDKLLHIPEDSVPCKIRAKRGCATHPRSIAERVRVNFGLSLRGKKQVEILSFGLFVFRKGCYFSLLILSIDIHFLGTHIE